MVSTRAQSSDVVVIGGGVVGSSAAYRLARGGARVTLIDREDEGQATAAGAGIVAPGTSFHAPAALHPLIRAAVGYYPTMLAELAEDGAEDIGYQVVGSLVVATTPAEADALAGVMATAFEQREAGVQGIGDVSRISGDEAKRVFPPLGPVAGAVHLSGSARVDGRRMRDALRRAARGRGAVFASGSARIVLEGGRPSHVAIDGERLTCGAVIVAAGAWSGEVLEPLQTSVPVYPQRGQILHMEMPAIETSGWPIVQGFHSHYLLTFPAHRIVAGATREDLSGYAPRITVGGVSEVIGEALRIAPGLSEAGVVELRVGLRPASPDGLPILGPVSEGSNIFVATGHGPSGLQLGPYSGALVADLALGKHVSVNPQPFSPARFRVS